MIQSGSVGDGMEPHGDLSPVVYPTLPSIVSAADEFVVDGWKMIAINRGDLNGDDEADVAVLMRKTDPMNVRSVTWSSYYEINDTNPYLLAIGFAERDGYVLTATHHALFPREVAPMHGDHPPDQDTVSIRNRVLTLSLGHMRGSEQVRFRWDGGAFVLIGYDCSGGARNDMVFLSANYLTRHASYDRGKVGSDDRTVSVVEILPGERPTLEQVGFDYSWTGTGVDGDPLTCRT